MTDHATSSSGARATPGAAQWDDRLFRLLTPHHLWSWHWGWRYGLALVVVAVCSALRWAFIPWLGTAVPHSIAVPAVVVATVLLGTGPGLLSMVLLIATGEGVILGSLPTIWTGPTLARLGTSLAAGGVIVGVLHGLRIARLRSEESEARLNSLYASMTEGLASHDMVYAGGNAVDYILTDVNPAFERITGIARERAVGERASALFGSGGPPYLDIYARVAESGKPESFETDFAPMGKSFHVSVFSPGKGRFATVFEDITSRKQAEAQIGRGQKTFAELVERSPFGTYVVDSQFRVAMMNAASQQGAFRNVRPVIGRDLSEAMRILWPEGVAAEIIGHFRDTLATGEPYFSRDFVNPRHDAEIVEAYEWELHRMTLPDGHHGVICYYYDSTKLRDAKATVQRERDRLSALVDSVTDEIWFADAEKNVTLVNRAVWQEFGSRVGDTKEVEKIAASLEVYRPDGTPRPVEDAPLLRALRGETVTEQEEIIRTPASGQLRHRQVNAAPVRDPDGAIIGSVSVVRDITGRKRGEEALESARAAAADANRQKDHFLAVLGHELRNPLAPINYSVALLKRLGPPDPVVQRAHDVIGRQVTHLTRLIDDLLDVSRIASGKITLRREELDLTAVVRRAVDDDRPLLEANGVTLTLTAPAEAVAILGDPARITQIVGNLLVNANKFTNRGGHVEVSLERDGERQAVIRVRDSGIGIDGETLARLFQPFAQADRSIHRSGGGLGLGLALVKGLVELHGGHVQAASAGTGRGAEFVVSLPCVVRGPAATSTPVANTGRVLRPRRILLIEDNHDAAESLQLLLELAGHKVAVAHSGAEGLEAARSHNPEVVLCDIGLPTMNGYEVAAAIRGTDDLRSVYLVALTGYGQDEDRRRALEAGFDHHLTKPVDPSALERLLESMKAT